jgi:hypothetical protein
MHITPHQTILQWILGDTKYKRLFGSYKTVDKSENGTTSIYI